MTRIAITGATGHLGGAVLDLLRKQHKVPAHRLRPLARSPKGLGWRARTFDYDTATGMAKALKGVDTLFLVSTWDFDRRVAQHERVLQAAQEAGVGHVVYASSVSPGEKDHLTGAHPATERLLRDSGLAWTALRATLYMSLFEPDIRTAARTGEFVTSLGKARTALIDRRDLARADAAVLADPAPHDGKTYTITGPTAVGAVDFADAAAELRGGPVAVRSLSRAATAKALAKRGLLGRDIDITLGLEDKMRSGLMANVSPDLRRLVGDAGSPFTDTLRTLLARMPR